MENELRENQLVMLDSIAEVQGAAANYTVNAGGMDYSNTDLGRGLRMAAQLLKAGVPLETAAMDFNIGWDSHSNQIPGANAANRFSDQNFGYHSRMRQGANDFVTFYRDMGAQMENVVVLVCTEFGRTVRENGTIGTDHGHASTWFAFGGPTQGGMADDVTSIAEDQLRNGRYLPHTTEFRDIVGEIMVRHMGMSQNLISTVFPGHSFTNHNLFTRGAA